MRAAQALARADMEGKSRQPLLLWVWEVASAETLVEGLCLLRNAIRLLGIYIPADLGDVMLNTMATDFFRE